MGSTRSKRSPSVPSRLRLSLEIGGSAAVVAFVLFGWAWFNSRPSSCRHLLTGASFAGRAAAFDNYVNSGLDHGSSCQLVNLAGTRGLLLASAAFSLFSGVLLWAMLARSWSRAWVIDQFRSAAVIRFVPLCAAVLDVAVHLLILGSIRLDRTPAGSTIVLGENIAKTLPALAWPKFIAFAVSVIALVVSWGAQINRQRLPLDGPTDGPIWSPPAKVGGLGICCSGGGIRAGSVALGALSSLEAVTVEAAGVRVLAPTERNGTRSVLDRSRYLASVSGGGYTAGAWRIARGTQSGPAVLESRLWPAGIVGDPLAYTEAPPTDYDSVAATGEPSLYRHVQSRRAFLRTGRGGLPASAVTALAFLAFHLLLLAATIAVVAWPFGRLSRSWFVFGGVGCQTLVLEVGGAEIAGVQGGDLGPELCHRASEAVTVAGTMDAGNRVIAKPEADPCASGTDPLLTHSETRAHCFLHRRGVQMPIKPSLTIPVISLGTLAGFVFLGKLVLWRTARRRRLTILSTAIGCSAAFVGILLLGLPMLVDATYPIVTNPAGGTLLAGSGLVGSVGVVAFRVAKRELGRRLALAGAVLLALAALAFFVVVAGQAALGDGLFSLGSDGRWAGYRWYLVLLAVMAVAYLVLDPRWWSLHTLYRNRLRGAFATSRRSADAPKALRRARLVQGETDEYEQGGARLYPFRQGKEPRLPAYADAPGPKPLICCSAARPTRTATGIRSLSMVFEPDKVTLYEPRYDAKLQVFCHEARAIDYMGALGKSAQAEGTLSALMAMSGAAVDSAMGRFDQRAPTALFAALNVRLGVWMPNPRYVHGSRRLPRTRLAYLLKDIVGYYRLDDHHVHVTDGGHRENLGLVELLRRRCRTIICIDASGDPPGSFATLRQAATLAQIEVAAVVDLRGLPSHADTPAAQPFVVLPVTYGDGPTKSEGQIVYVWATVCADLPVGLQAFLAEDPRFPQYSTGDQFLSERQFRHLVLYGQEAMRRALADPSVQVAVANAVLQAT